MSEHFAAWTKGSHHAVATCNDCHTPHALIPKYMVKARNGFWHSFYFTVGGYPDPLRITEGNRRSCHAEITEAIDYAASGNAAPMRLATRTSGGAPTSPPHDAGTRAGEPISCIRCHRYVGHWVR